MGDLVLLLGRWSCGNVSLCRDYLGGWGDWSIRVSMSESHAHFCFLWEMLARGKGWLKAVVVGVEVFSHVFPEI